MSRTYTSVPEPRYVEKAKNAETAEHIEGVNIKSTNTTAGKVPIANGEGGVLWSNIFTMPECPAETDGTFTLKATVADGAVTYAWVLEE